MPECIIDTHVHVWNFDRVRYEWLEGDTSVLNRSYHIEELEEQRLPAGVTGGILVQAANNREDTDWMLEVAANTDWINGVVGWLPLMDPEAAGLALEEYLHNPYFKGVRHLIHNEPDETWLLQPAVLESLSILASYNVPYDLVGIKTGHIKTALKVAEKIPGLRMVFDHMNQPPIPAGIALGNWGELMREAAGNANMYVKISGLGTASGNFTGWTARDLLPSIEFILNQFTADRCFCGGDWPVSLLAGSYSTTWQAYRAVLDVLTDQTAKEKILCLNAGRFYNL
jgi:L-fuconolactonase